MGSPHTATKTSHSLYSSSSQTQHRHPYSTSHHYSHSNLPSSFLTSPQHQPQQQSSHYSKNRYDRLCQRSDGLKGFHIGHHTQTKEQCYYICADHRYLRRPFYYCCPTDYRMDYDLRLCVLKQPTTTTTTTTTVAPTALKRRLTGKERNRLNFPHYYWDNDLPSRSSPNPPIPTVENPMGKCKPGDPMYKSHPSKCNHYLQCVFNLVYIDMKCPMNLWWNDKIKFCDIKRNSICYKPKEPSYLDSWGQRQTKKPKISKTSTTTTISTTPNPPKKTYIDDSQSGVES